MPRLSGHPCDHANVRLLCRRKKSFSRLLSEQIVFDLNGFCAAIFHCGAAFIHAVDGNTIVADLAGLFGALEHFPNRAAFDDLDGRVMQLIEIDVVGLQAARLSSITRLI
jgi:hypothetical protein